jgi:hypothetical protein
LARAWFRLARPKVKFVVRVPLNVTLGEGIDRAVDPVDFDPAQPCHGRAVERFTLEEALLERAKGLMERVG